MMLEISVLQARVAHLEEEKSSLEEQLSLRSKERYDPLVRQLFCTCIQLKAGLAEHHWQTEQDVSLMVNRARAEGVDRIKQLKKKNSCSQDSQNNALAIPQIKKEEEHEFSMEKNRMNALLCKLKALSLWRKVVDQEKLHRQLYQTQQREIMSRIAALRLKTTLEEKVFFLKQELDITQQMLSRCQTENSSIKKQLSGMTEELQAIRHQSAQEAQRKQELDRCRVQSLEQMRANVEDRDKKLREIREQLDRSSSTHQLERQRSTKEIQQVRAQLRQERCLKLEAFQQVDKLNDKVTNIEATFSRCTSGQSRVLSTVSVNRLSSRGFSAGLHRDAQQQSGNSINRTAQQDFTTEPRRQRANTARSLLNAGINRPKAVSEFCLF